MHSDEPTDPPGVAVLRQELLNAGIRVDPPFHIIDGLGGPRAVQRLYHPRPLEVLRRYGERAKKTYDDKKGANLFWTNSYDLAILAGKSPEFIRKVLRAAKDPQGISGTPLRDLEDFANIPGFELDDLIQQLRDYYQAENFARHCVDVAVRALRARRLENDEPYDSEAVESAEASETEMSLVLHLIVKLAAVDDDAVLTQEKPFVNWLADTDGRLVAHSNPSPSTRSFAQLDDVGRYLLLIGVADFFAVRQLHASFAKTLASLTTMAGNELTKNDECWQAAKLLGTVWLKFADWLTSFDKGRHRARKDGVQFTAELFAQEADENNANQLNHDLRKYGLEQEYFWNENVTLGRLIMQSNYREYAVKLLRWKPEAAIGFFDPGMEPVS